MKLTLENLIDEIVDREYDYYKRMVSVEETYGNDSEYFKFWENKWEVIYNLASKFNFVDKLKR